MNNKRNKKSPFTTFCTTAVACILIFSAGFTVLMFKTDMVATVSSSQRDAARDIKTPTTVTQITRAIEQKKQQQTNLGMTGTGSGGDPSINPTVPGVSTSFSSNGQWYQDLTDEMKQGGGTIAATVDVGGATIGLYSNLPWPATDAAFAFNAPVAQRDVIAWLEQGGSTGIDPNRRGVFVYEHNGATFTQEVEGVLCLGFAPVPSVVDKTYCDAFTQTAWASQSTPPRDLYGYDGARKYCAILEKDGTTYYLPLVAKDAKGHTFPGGALQTHMQITGNNGGAYVLNIGDGGHRGISWSVTDIVANLDNIVSSAEASPLRDYIKVNIEIYYAPSGSLSELNQYTIVGFVAY